LQNYTFNLNSGAFVLTFDEPVSFDSLTPSVFVLSDRENKTGDNYAMTGVKSTGSDGQVVQFSLSPSTPSDFLFIKAFDNLGKSKLYTWLSGAAVIKDMNEITGSITTPVNVLTYFDDSTPPTFQQFDIYDANDNLIYLTFDEPVDITTFDARYLTVCSNPTVNPACHTLTATTTDIVFVNGVVLDSSTKLSVRIKPSYEDYEAMKLTTGFGIADINTYAYVSTGMIKDRAGINITGIPQSAAKQAVLFIQDTATANLVAWDFNINVGTLSLTYDDIIDTSTLIMKDNIDIVQAPNAGPSQTYTLQGGTTQSADGYFVDVTLLWSDILNLKRLQTVARDNLTTYVVTRTGTFGLIKDINLLAVNATVLSHAHRVSLYTPDVVRPNVTAIDLNMDTRTVVFNFSDVVDKLQFNASSLQLQDAALASTRNASSSCQTACTGAAFALPASTAACMSACLAPLDLGYGVCRDACHSSYTDDTTAAYVTLVSDGSTDLYDTVLPCTMGCGFLFNNLPHVAEPFAITMVLPSPTLPPTSTTPVCWSRTWQGTASS
jgi:hypothetical protein